MAPRTPKPWTPATPLQSVTDFEQDLASARAAFAQIDSERAAAAQELEQLPIASSDEPAARAAIAAIDVRKESLARAIRQLEAGLQTARDAEKAAAVEQIVQSAIAAREQMKELASVIDGLQQVLATKLRELAKAHATLYRAVNGSIAGYRAAEMLGTDLPAAHHVPDVLHHVQLTRLIDGVHLWPPR